MKIVQINAVVEYSSTGRIVSELHEALQVSGHQSWVAATNAVDSPGLIKIGNVTDRKFHGLYSRISGRQGYASWRSTLRLVDKLKAIKPDVVHLHNLHGNYINLPILLEYLGENDIPVVVTLHDCWFFTGHCCYFVDTDCNRWQHGCGKCPDLRNWNTSWFFDRSHTNLKDKERLFRGIKRLAVIGVSKWVTGFVKYSILKNARIIRPVYNWIDTDVFYPQENTEFRSRFASPDEKVVLGVSHLWDNHKGLNDFIALAKAMPTYKFVLVGKIDEGIGLPTNMFAPGQTADVNELAGYYSMSDVFFNPSKRETFGKVTAEALSCGTPVVAYDTTATPELVPPGCGGLVAPGDLNSAADKIIKTANTPGLRESCRDFARKTFSKSQLISEIIDIYTKISES